MNAETAIFCASKVTKPVSGRAEEVPMGSPLCRIRLLAAKSNKLINIKSRVVVFAVGISSLDAEDNSAIVANIMLDTPIYIRGKFSIFMLLLTVIGFHIKSWVLLFSAFANPIASEFTIK
jgi:hypothetical protein